MIKDATYKEKFQLLDRWLPTIIEQIKKDLKNDHLKKDYVFVKKYIINKNLNKISTEELTQAYLKALKEEEASESIAEFISNRWLLKNTEIYDFFEEELKKITDDFASLQEIDQETSYQLVSKSTELFGPTRTYLFSVLNSVVFPKSVYQELEAQAANETEKQSSEGMLNREKMSLEALQKHFDQQLCRVTDRYEKKLQGLQKKYLQDVESLKKQVSTLQKKINSGS